MTPSRTASALRGLLLTSAAASASACTTMRVQSDPVPQSIPQGGDKAQEVRFTRRSGNVITLYDVRLQGDSVIGFDRPMAVRNAVRIAIPTSDIREVAVKEHDQFKTVLAVGGGVLAALTIIFVVACLSALGGEAI